jgi:iron(III) transport system permease protein
MIVTDYGVPLIIGGKYATLPVVMYQDVIGLLDFGKGSVIGMVLLVPAAIACVVDVMNRDKGNMAYVTKRFAIRENKSRDTVCFLACLCVAVLVLLPIATFCVICLMRKYPLDMSFSTTHIHQSIASHVGTYLRNSVVISVGVTAIGTATALAAAYYAARMKSVLSRLLHMLSVVSIAVPGIVLGLSYILFFKGSWLYGTICLLMLVNAVHFFSSPYLMAYNAFGKMNENLESVGMTLGVGRFRVFLDVLLPSVKGTVCEMAAYFFVNSMMTISAVSFLANTSNKPVALMINQFEAQMQLENAAFVSLMIMFVNIAVKLLFAAINRKAEQRLD